MCGRNSIFDIIIFGFNLIKFWLLCHTTDGSLYTGVQKGLANNKNLFSLYTFVSFCFVKPQFTVCSPHYCYHICGNSLKIETISLIFHERKSQNSFCNKNGFLIATYHSVIFNELTSKDCFSLENNKLCVL